MMDQVLATRIPEVEKSMKREKYKNFLFYVSLLISSLVSLICLILAFQEVQFLKLFAVGMLIAFLCFQRYASTGEVIETRRHQLRILNLQKEVNVFSAYTLVKIYAVGNGLMNDGGFYPQNILVYKGTEDNLANKRSFFLFDILRMPDNTGELLSPFHYRVSTMTGTVWWFDEKKN